MTPLRTEESSSAPEPRPPVVAPPRARILVVDDEERLATTLRIALSAKHDVDVATKGRDALALLRSEHYDVVLCDLLLPDISGPDIYEEIGRTHPDVAAKFVFLTGGAFTPKARTFLEHVANPRLEKPFDLNSLEALIADRLSRA